VTPIEIGVAERPARLAEARDGKVAISRSIADGTPSELASTRMSDSLGGKLWLNSL